MGMRKNVWVNSRIPIKKGKIEKKCKLKSFRFDIFFFAQS